MATTLTRTDVNGGSAVDLGQVQRCRSNKDEQFDVQTFPGSNSDQTDVISMSGASRVFNLEIRNSFANVTDMKNFVSYLEAFCNGNQDIAGAGYTTYYDELRAASYKVKVGNLQIEYQAGTVLEVYATMTLTECSVYA